MDMSKHKFPCRWHKALVFLALFILGISIVLADAGDFAEAKKLIGAKAACSSLNEKQLEGIGDYLMEQTHPGEAHEAMDKMMGGEGSESLRLMHIAIAKRIYCNDVNSSIGYGFAGMMGGYGMMRGLKDNYSDDWGMMGFGKNNYGGMRNMMGYNFGYGMMGSGYGYWGLLNFLSFVLVIGLVILVYLWIIKLWKQVSKKEK
ncbi:hypothetical protein HYX08_00780 [Candidatus Woesearchaeota archaeon]|nr:hypothetical protein [Candidatus Woesearchaeota archaeon]